jgi:hypothetical protein
MVQSAGSAQNASEPAYKSHAVSKGFDTMGVALTKLLAEHQG